MPESDEYAREYFDGQWQSNREFWRRFGNRPEVAHKRILEVGCGHGAMSIELALNGATVLGVDLDEDRIDFAQRNLAERFPELESQVTFSTTDATGLPTDEPFDIIVSKDTFEHVEDVTALLEGLGALLKPDGVAYVGFSPLYYSPFGDHGRSGLKVPWAHAALPQRVVCAAAGRHNHMRVNSLFDIGLNANTPRQFRASFEASGLSVLDIRYNAGDKKLLKVMSWFGARFPALERFVTVSVYAKFGPAKASNLELDHPVDM